MQKTARRDEFENHHIPPYSRLNERSRGRHLSGRRAASFGLWYTVCSVSVRTSARDTTDYGLRYSTVELRLDTAYTVHWIAIGLYS